MFKTNKSVQKIMYYSELVDAHNNNKLLLDLMLYKIPLWRPVTMLLLNTWRSDAHYDSITEICSEEGSSENHVCQTWVSRCTWRKGAHKTLIRHSNMPRCHQQLLEYYKDTTSCVFHDQKDTKDKTSTSRSIRAITLNALITSYFIQIHKKLV